MRLRVDYDEIFDYYEVRVKIRGALSRVEYYGEEYYYEDDDDDESCKYIYTYKIGDVMHLHIKWWA